MSYLVSMSKDVLASHPEFTRLTQLGEAVLYENRHKRNFSFYIGESDNHYYFRVAIGELEEVVEELLCSSINPARFGQVAVQHRLEQNLPENLREAYKKFFAEHGFF
ncbi:MAG TPA: hypothetical protein VJB05_00860 [archaeon]|nr:hypothetical protein [archaeon]